MNHLVQKLKKDSWLELQFSLADNSKLNVVYLLNRRINVSRSLEEVPPNSKNDIPPRDKSMLTATRTRMTQDAINELIAKRVDVALKASMPTAIRTRMTQDAINELIAKRVDVALKVTVGVDEAYAMTWKALMKLMTEVYCPRNEIQKMETELWNLTVKSNDLTAYNQMFQELTLLCIKMVPKEEDKVDKYIGDLSYSIQGNVIAAEPNAENKRRFDSSSRDNRGQQQQPFKRQNISGQNVTRAYTVGNNVERKGYAGVLPYCSKCRKHHKGSCMAQCGNCKRVDYMTRNCRLQLLLPLRGPRLEIKREILAMSVEDQDIIGMSFPS
ncbi:putative reverse transcriptase domain-containing protein [Tanacetum coccineum]